MGLGVIAQPFFNITAMSKYKKIVGVSVNTENPPSRKDLINSALQSAEYYRKQNAIEEINEKINKSGLYRSIPKKPKKDDIQK